MAICSAADVLGNDVVSSSIVSLTVAFLTGDLSFCVEGFGEVDAASVFSPRDRGLSSVCFWSKPETANLLLGVEDVGGSLNMDASEGFFSKVRVPTVFDA